MIQRDVLIADRQNSLVVLTSFAFESVRSLERNNSNLAGEITVRYPLVDPKNEMYQK